MKKCKHKWVDMEDGTFDKFCVRCRKFAMQAQLAMPASELSVETKIEGSISLSITPEQIVKRFNEDLFKKDYMCKFVGD